MSQSVVFDPKVLSPDDLAVLKKHRSRLATFVEAEPDTDGSSVIVRLQDGEGEDQVILPPAFAHAIVAVLAEVADGYAVHMTPVVGELTTQQAADLLNVSRPFFIKLLKQGAIPYRSVGTHRRVQHADVLAYKATMYREAQHALQDLADQAQDLSLGYD